MKGALTPEEIRGADFSVALRGYDRVQVKAFLEDLAGRVSILKESSEKTYQAVGEELGELLQEARDLADKIRSDARSEATALVEDAAKEAAGIRKDAAAYAKQVLDAADTDAASERDQASEEAGKTRAQANEEAASMRAQATEDAEQRISAAENKVSELESVEAETRRRISSLRTELEEVAKSLLQLDGDGSHPTEIETPLEEQIDQHGRVDAVPNGAVEAHIR